MKSFLSLLVAFASATSALAQAPAPDQPILPRTTNILEAMIAAGPVMLLLFLLSVFSVMLIIVYFFTIRRYQLTKGIHRAFVKAFNIHKIMDHFYFLFYFKIPESFFFQVF